MKINYTMFGVGLTGGTRVILEIANGLVERGHEVSITTLGNPSDIKWFPLKARIKFIPLSFWERAIRKGIKEIFQIYSYPEREIAQLTRAIPECDINVATFCLTAFSVFRSERGAPFYHMQHYEPLFFDDPYLKRLAEESYYLPLNKIANSSWLKKKLEEVHCIYNATSIFPAIDHKVFYPRPRKMASEKKRIISLVKATPWKGFSDVVETMRIVLKERSDVELFCFGTSFPRNNYSDIPIRIFHGLYDENLAQLYCESDVFLSASWYESFPLPPLEAMACGIPVVTTGYGTEDYCHGGFNCLVVSARKPREMANAILEILENSDLSDKLRGNGLKTAANFSWSRTIDSVEEIFLNL